MSTLLYHVMSYTGPKAGSQRLCECDPKCAFKKRTFAKHICDEREKPSYERESDVPCFAFRSQIVSHDVGGLDGESLPPLIFV